MLHPRSEQGGDTPELLTDTPEAPAAEKVELRNHLKEDKDEECLPTVVVENVLPLTGELISSHDPMEVLEAGSPNDALSDETHFDHGGPGSNESSNQPSPTRLGLLNNGDEKANHALDMSQEAIVKSSQGARTGNQLGQSGNEGYQEKISEVDIAEFIDNFLGADDLMRNVPDLSSDAPHEPPPVDGVLTSQHQNPKQQPGSKDNVLHIMSERGPLATRLSEKQALYTEKTAKPSTTTNNSPPSAVPKKSEKRKPRTYTQAVPSQHCHICSRRPTEGSPHQVCGNLLKGRCRKTICTKCFLQFRWDLQAARTAPPGTWECPHCRGECPQRAQCVIYNRTSDRRRLKLINHRKRKTDASRGKGQKSGPSNKKQNTSKGMSPDSGRTIMTLTPGFQSPHQNNDFGAVSTRRNERRSKKVDYQVARPGRVQALDGTGYDVRQARSRDNLQMKVANVFPTKALLEFEKVGAGVEPSSLQYGNNMMMHQNFSGPVATLAEGLQQNCGPMTRIPNVAQVEEALAQGGVQHAAHLDVVPFRKEDGHESSLGMKSFLMTESPVSLSGDLESDSCSVLRATDGCVEELLPRTGLEVQDLSMGVGQEAPDDLWILHDPTEDVDGSAAEKQGDGDGLLSLLCEEECDTVELSCGRLGYHGNRRFGKV